MNYQEKNDFTDGGKMNEQHKESLNFIEQLRCLALGLTLSSFLAGSFYYLIRLDQSLNSQIAAWSPELLIWASVGGLFGGSARALFMFIWEIGGRGERKDISFYLDRWFLYLFKPFMGGASGVLFFLSVNLGLVRVFANEPNFEFSSVILVSSVGGIFFEEVFGNLQKLIPKANKAENEEKKQ